MSQWRNGSARLVPRSTAEVRVLLHFGVDVPSLLKCASGTDTTAQLDFIVYNRNAPYFLIYERCVRVALQVVQPLFSFLGKMVS